jgi:hypothetical protein
VSDPKPKRLIPKWFQVTFLGFLGTIVVSSLLTWPVFYSTLGSIESTSNTDISQLLLWSPGGRSQKLPIDAWDALRGPISEGSKIYYAGLRGEKYTRFCSLEIDIEGAYLGYVLELRTRPSMKGIIELELQRGSPGSHWTYGSYSGNDLLMVLQERYPEMCKPQTN